MFLAYVVMMTGQKFKLVSVLNILTAIFIILDMYFAFSYYMLSPQKQIHFLEQLSSENLPVEVNIMNVICDIMFLAYLIAAYVHIYKHIKAVKNFYSDLEKIRVQYVHYFVILHIVLGLAAVSFDVVFPSKIVNFLCMPLFVNFFYLYIVYYAFNHNAILSQPEYCNLVLNVSSLENYKKFEEPLCREIEEIKRNKGKSSHKLTEMELEENFIKIKKCFEEQKPYLDPTINLTKLSGLLNACSHNISLTINTRFDMNFFDLINTYRIEEAKLLLQQIGTKNITIEACSFDAGFNSKMSFYRAFKKHVKMTPLEYIQSIKN
jgi:AraC-like DNA-binding protein